MFQSRIWLLSPRLPSALKQTSQSCRKSLIYSHTIRGLSFTAPCRATETSKPDNEALATAFKGTSTYQKISKRPEAILAIQKFAEVLQKQGVDTSSGKPPSMLQMSKLMLNSEFREASKDLMEEFKKAGIDPNDKTMVDEITNLMKNPKI